MTTQELRDKFYLTRCADKRFAEKYFYTAEGFQKWLDDYCLGSDD